jgi:transcriptional regulator with XRE-family HTH domain
LSDRIGVGIRIIGDWESGRKLPRFDNAVALARELGVSLKFLAKVMQINVEGVPDDELQEQWPSKED